MVDETDIEYWLDQARGQYRQKQYEESVSSAVEAIGIDDDDYRGWWWSALGNFALSDFDEALTDLEMVVETNPNFANGWSRYGAVLQIQDLDARAQEAFEEALEIDGSHIDALTALARIYQQNDSDDQGDITKEIDLLTRLNLEEGLLNSRNLNRLGILHYNNKEFFDAIKYWNRNTQNTNDQASLFNLGLAYSNPEVSQDADAIDVWRLALQRSPDYTKPLRQIESLLPRLVALSEKAHDAGSTLLEPHEWYRHYISPFELLNLSGSEIDNSENLDVKVIQNLKKRLNQEIELGNGTIPWMENLRIDRSTAISICEELYDEQKKAFHLEVFKNKPLLGFLSRGEHGHFTVDEGWSPLETIEYLGVAETGFREWLSPLFADQFDQVFRKAMDLENLVILEVLLDGRRWIQWSETDRCFRNARRKVDQRLTELVKASKKAEEAKPSLDEIKTLWRKNSLFSMLNLFPTFFWEQQDKAVNLLCEIAVSCYNVHSDSELCMKILKFAKTFSFKSVVSTNRIERDVGVVSEIIEEERSSEAFLISGTKARWEITKDGVREGDKFIPADSVASFRFGVQIDASDGKLEYDFLFVFKDTKGVEVKYQWATKKNLDKQKEFNLKFIRATNRYILPKILNRHAENLKSGRTIKIGSCTITQKGVEFNSRSLIFSKRHFLPWSRVSTEIENGQLIIMDAHSKKIRTEFSVRETDNAWVLHNLKEQMG
jgi:tetratricopeptide (TPR) repeat protein